jgi:hypothetical protein
VVHLKPQWNKWFFRVSSGSTGTVGSSRCCWYKWCFSNIRYKWLFRFIWFYRYCRFIRSSRYFRIKSNKWNFRFKR